MNLLGIDFEDWFHPELIQRHITTKNNKPITTLTLNAVINP